LVGSMSNSSSTTTAKLGLQAIALICNISEHNNRSHAQ
jgi:hypothetical protein